MTETRHKRGDVREDGKVFWGYHSGCRNGENWMDAEKFQDYRSRQLLQGSQKRQSEEHRERYLAYDKGRYARDEDYRNRQLQQKKDPESKEASNKRRRELRATNPLVMLKSRLRSRTQTAFRQSGKKKKASTESLLGCSFEELKAHIENQFTEGMSWENRSEWHVDHIKPLASATSEEELYKLCYYTNLQPLWAKDNMSKGAKILN